jgi:hypothetical protein
MAAKDQIVCHVCGFKNAPEAARCVSCGAKLEAVQADYNDEELAARRNQQEGFSAKWVAVAFLIYTLLQAVVLVALPAVISSYDPQGFWGLVISVVVWFVGGIAVGFISPGKTFLEPAVGALVAAIPTIAYLMWITPAAPHAITPGRDLGPGFDPGILAYVVGGLLGVMISLFGGFLGEKIQSATRGHAKA